jgi:hypothetical protein
MKPSGTTIQKQIDKVHVSFITIKTNCVALMGAAKTNY